MDRNTIIGFLLIGAMLITMFVVNSRSRLKYEGEQKRIQDSIAALQPRPDTAKARLDSIKVDSIKTIKVQQSIGSTTATAQSVTVENEVMKISFTSKGAQPQMVTLKKFQRFDGSPVVIQKGNFNKFTYKVAGGNNLTMESADIIFNTQPVVKNNDGSQSVSFTTGDSSGHRKITHRFTLKPNDYMVDFDIAINGASSLIGQNKLSLLWQTQADQIEKDHAYEQAQTEICFLENKEYDFERAASGGRKVLGAQVNWIAQKQQFFIAALSAPNNFSGAEINWAASADTNSFIAQTTVNTHISLKPGENLNIPLHFYYGPSDYNILKKYGNQMQNIVPYGSGVFAFVKYINRHVLLPVFNYLKDNIASMGMVILLLTLFIRLITSPILYKSYLSGAKMKVLKPEVDQLKEKLTDPKTGKYDQQAFGMEQMKLWRSAGVNPLGGCIPALLQIPIFMSLYYFFQSNIDLRGKHFLWAEDLAAYDSILKLPFSIPFYGDHVSLFTITATVTSMLISIYSMSQMQDNSNPVMKYMPYIFPIMLLGVFNRLPSALTWYYTISNTITLILQIVIQKYIINHDKILAQLNENKKKPQKQSKLQERIQAMQDAQKKIKDMKEKTAKK
ncbi:MAG: membrane protein insertase YidC [Chitinophagaceae bacterium]|nr:membrane protein insertase YidC [Chitinophagaceae bacterium]MBP6046566.1 membrane protein insertase YidC [Ferruginibacter sp.]MBK7089768.1 membrane protein insertase YidC [Chitinophagaceae bacterium]MBK7347497.1 membrane protein insertase YidC [Chitinophagaceae bacterium]MBK7734147.1 membrane protein insertase YidC [Chitinophagaceae bacterium]